jgi:hypothetical protein
VQQAQQGLQNKDEAAGVQAEAGVVKVSLAIQLEFMTEQVAQAAQAAIVVVAVAVAQVRYMVVLVQLPEQAEQAAVVKSTCWS